MTVPLARPDASEYSAYFGKYIALVPDGDVLVHLAAQGKETASLLLGALGKADHRYAPGKWSVKQVIGHVTDAERVFIYRALRFARGDRTPLPGFDEQAWAADGETGRTLEDLVAEFEAVRGATLAFARSLSAEATTRTGPANDATVSVRALLYITAGHERHHVALLRERYGL